MIKLSIITVVYNRASTIEDAIISLISQDFLNIEYLVIDGGSNDGTYDVIKKYEDRIDILLSEKDKGVYDAINKGIDLATGDIIGLLHSDDVFCSTKSLSVVANQFLSNPDIDVLTGNALLIGQDGQTLSRIFRSSHFKKSMLRFGFMPPHTSTFVRKSCYDKIGKYNTAYEIASDFEWFCRLYFEKNILIKSLDCNLVQMRSGGLSTSGLKSIITISNEINSILKSKNIYSNLLFIYLRLPIKYLLKIFKI